MSCNVMETSSMKYEGMEISKKEVKELFNQDLKNAEMLKRNHYAETGKQLTRADQKELFKIAVQTGKAYEYLKKRLMKTRCGKVGVIHDDALEILEKEEFGDHYGGFIKGLDTTFGPVLHNELYSQCVEEWTIKVNKGGKMIDDQSHILNLCKEPAMYYSPEFTPSKKDEELVERFFDYMLKVMCSGNQEQADYLLDWLSLVLRMEQTEVIVAVITRAGGTGKSRFVKACQKLLGELMMTLSAAVAEGRDLFTFPMVGRALCMIEELAEQDFVAKDNMLRFLKNYSTSPLYAFRKMHKEAITCPNFGNVLITSNFACDLRDRRIFTPDMTTQFVGEKEYFGKLDECLESKTAMKHLFNLLWTRKITMEEFRKKDVMSNQKTDFLKYSLRTPVLFIKETFVLPKIKLDVRTKDLYEMYLSFCKVKKFKENQISGKTGFFQEVIELGVVKRKSHGIEYFGGEVDVMTDMMKRLKYLQQSDYAEFEADQNYDVLNELKPEEQIRDVENEIAKSQVKLMILRKKNHAQSEEPEKDDGEAMEIPSKPVEIPKKHKKKLDKDVHEVFADLKKEMAEIQEI